jgi:hypothetical protein
MAKYRGSQTDQLENEITQLEQSMQPEVEQQPVAQANDSEDTGPSEWRCSLSFSID